MTTPIKKLTPEELKQKINFIRDTSHSNSEWREIRLACHAIEEHISALEAENGELRERLIKEHLPQEYENWDKVWSAMVKTQKERDQLKAENGELTKQNGGISIVCKENAQLRAQLEELKTNFIKFTELPAGDARITGQKLDSCERQCKRQEDEIDQLHAQVSEMRFILTIFKTVHEDCGRPSLTPIGRDRFEMIYRALRGETNLKPE